jgi:hypothetical protein
VALRAALPQHRFECFDGELNRNLSDTQKSTNKFQNTKGAIAQKRAQSRFSGVKLARVMCAL